MMRRIWIVFLTMPSTVDGAIKRQYLVPTPFTIMHGE
jgi:hypothetical protein